MINNIKSEVEKRTGLPANVVDKVINSLGEIVSEKYPQYAGMLGPILGVPTTGTTGTTGTSATTGGSGMPDLGNLGGLLGGLGQNQTDQGSGSQQSNTTNKG